MSDNPTEDYLDVAIGAMTGNSPEVRARRSALTFLRERLRAARGSTTPADGGAGPNDPVSQKKGNGG